MATRFSGRFSGPKFKGFSVTTLFQQPWMAYNSQRDRLSTLSVLPVTAVLDTAIVSNPSAWHAKYAAADDVLRLGATVPVSAVYKGRDVPDSPWTAYAGTADVLRAEPTIPVSATYRSRDVPDSPWTAYAASADVLRVEPNFPTTAVSAF